MFPFWSFTAILLKKTLVDIKKTPIFWTCYFNQLHRCTHILHSGSRSQIWWQLGAQITKILGGAGKAFPPLLCSRAVPTHPWIPWDFSLCHQPRCRRNLVRKAESSAPWGPEQHKGQAAGAPAIKQVAASPPTFPAWQKDATSAIRPQMHSKQARPVLFAPGPNSAIVFISISHKTIRAVFCNAALIQNLV